MSYIIKVTYSKKYGLDKEEANYLQDVQCTLTSKCLEYAKNRSEAKIFKDQKAAREAKFMIQGMKPNLRVHILDSAIKEE